MSDEKKTIKFQMMLSESEMAAIEDWRFGNRVDSRAEAIRRLCQIGLSASAHMEDLEKFLKIFPLVSDHMFELLTDNKKARTKDELQAMKDDWIAFLALSKSVIAVYGSALLSRSEKDVASLESKIAYINEYIDKDPNFGAASKKKR